MSNLLTVREVSERLRCSSSTVYNLVSAGRLRAHRIGLGRGKVLIPEAAVEEMLLASQQQERAPPREQLRHLKM